jgi:hypothetical protein
VEGSTDVTTTTTSSRWRVPQGALRVSLSLPQSAWALWLDEHDRVAGLCAPRVDAGPWTTCVLSVSGGSVVLVDAPQARAQVVRMGAPVVTALRGLAEHGASADDDSSFDVPPAPTARALHIEGEHDLRCTLVLDDGTLLPRCRGDLPANHGAVVHVVHHGQPWRAWVSSDSDAAARMGPPPTGNAWLTALPVQAGREVALSGSVVDRRIDLPSAALVQFQSSAGVCAVVDGEHVVTSGGGASGCTLTRVLAAGPHRVVVRGFAGASLVGSLSYTAEPLAVLDEGVGPTAVLAPGDTRAYTFTLPRSGPVGIGVQAPADVLRCALVDVDDVVRGTGCHQLTMLPAGRYVLRVESGEARAPLSFAPVVRGLKGGPVDVPPEVLRELLGRVQSVEEVTP